MQIAKVVPKVKTKGGGIFDYAIPPQILADIKIGLLVLVPFHNRKIEGIVVDIKRSSVIPNLKPIISIIDTNPVIDKVHTELARWMADYYITDFSKTLFENVVPPAKRAIKKSLLQETESLVNLTKFPSGKKYLIVAEFKDRLKFYLRAIKKTSAERRQTIILVPDLSLVSYFTNFIKNKTSVLHAGLTLTERWVEWNKIRHGEVEVIIGANSALFAPSQNLGLIIVDQEENETYKSDQAPRYHALKVAYKLASFTNVSLIAGSITPDIETYFEANKQNYLFTQVDTAERHISIVDMNTEKRIISETLKHKIDEKLQIQEKVILVINRKGEGSKLKCADCGWVHTCPNCSIPIAPIADNSYCANCEKYFPNPVKCGACSGSNFKVIGITTKRLQKIIQELWPKSQVIISEKDGPVITQKSSWDIAIVTNFALKMNFPKTGLVAIIDADQGLNFPDFRSKETSFQSTYKFLKLAKIGLIQTHFPQSDFIKNLAALDYPAFFASELTSREKYHFPPFCKLIKILYRDKNEEQCTRESNRVKACLEEITQKNNIEAEVLGPTPTFAAKKRDYFYYKIVLKINKRETLLDNFLKILPKGWIVDVDPFNLL